MKDEVLLPENGELFGLEEFIDKCGKGLFFDRDGEGYYSDGRVYWKDEKAIPSELLKGRIHYNFHFRFVVWFKK